MLHTYTMHRVKQAFDRTKAGGDVQTRRDYWARVANFAVTGRACVANFGYMLQILL